MTTTHETIARPGAYVDAGGVRTYYEVHGTGDPVVLLHGGLCTAETFDGMTPRLADHYQVIVPERIGHGRTPDCDGPITYEGMAQQTVAFLEAMDLEAAHLVGWSDGALVALLVALRRPKLVRKIVLIDQFVSLDGAGAGYEELMAGFSIAHVPPMLAAAYEALSPDGPDHLPVVVDKLQRMWVAPTGIDVSDLAHVVAPTLVMNGDKGGVTLRHLEAVRRTLPDVQVAIVPGTSHAIPLEKPELASRLVLDFLADEQVELLLALPSD